MEIILLNKIAKLGDLGDVVQVKPGYARNYLFPRQQAIPASAEHRAEFAGRRADLERLAQKHRAAADERAQQLLERGALTVISNAGKDGKLYGSVGAREITEAAKRAGIDLEKSEIVLPDGALRQTGPCTVEVRLHPDLSVTLDLIVSPA